MRRIAIFLSFFLNLFPAKSQERLFTYQNDDHWVKWLIPSIITIEENNAFIYTQSDKKRILRFLGSRQSTTNLLEQRLKSSPSNEGFKYYSVIEEKLLKLYWRDLIIGGAYKSRQIVEAARDDINSDFYFIETDLTTGLSKFSDTIHSRFTEKIVSCFNKKGKLYILTVTRNSDQLTIYTKEIGSPVQKAVKEISISNFGRSSKNIFAENINNFSDIFFSRQFVLYQGNQRSPPLLTSYRNKAYLLDDQIIFTVSSNNLVTYVITLDLQNFNYTLKQFNQQPDGPSFVSAVTSSCIASKNLVTCHINEDKVVLNIFNLSGEKIKSIEIDERNIDSFAAEAVQKTGSFLSKSDIKKDNLRRFLTAAKNNELTISTYEENNTLFISVAAPYKQIINGTKLLNLALTVAGTYGINSAPNYSGYLISNYNGANTSTYVGFDLSLDQNLFSSKKTANFSVWDNLNLFISTRSYPDKNRLFFFMNGFYYVGDYIKDTYTYNIYCFDQGGTR
jgi:hypothetical protein